MTGATSPANRPRFEPLSINAFTSDSSYSGALVRPHRTAGARLSWAALCAGAFMHHVPCMPGLQPLTMQLPLCQVTAARSMPSAVARNDRRVHEQAAAATAGRGARTSVRQPCASMSQGPGLPGAAPQPLCHCLPQPAALYACMAFKMSAAGVSDLPSSMVWSRFQ